MAKSPSVKQLKIADSLFSWGASKRKETKMSKKLTKINALIHWEEIEEMCKKCLNIPTKVGRPSLSLLVKIKSLFFQRLYDLSDEKLEDFIIDNLSVQRFVGISVSDVVPDFTTIWRFREKLSRAGIDAKLWETVHAQIASHKVEIKQVSCFTTLLMKIDCFYMRI